MGGAGNDPTRHTFDIPPRPSPTTKIYERDLTFASLLNERLDKPPSSLTFEVFYGRPLHHGNNKNTWKVYGSFQAPPTLLRSRVD